jgi:signal recognition particle receptor subunit beta
MNLNDYLKTDKVKAFIHVTGAYDSGKEDFITLLSDTAEKAGVVLELQPGRETTDLFIGRVAIHDHLTLFLLGMAGSMPIDYSALPPEFLGMIIVMDCTRPATFRETKSIREAFKARSPFPYVVAVHEQNHPDAWPLDKLPERLRFEENETVMPFDATRKASAAKILLALLAATPRRELAASIAAKIGGIAPELTNAPDSLDSE